MKATLVSNRAMFLDRLQHLTNLTSWIWGSNKIRFEPPSQIARSTIQLGFQHMLIYVDMYWITEHIWTHSYILHADHWPPLLLFTGVASSTAGFSPWETMPLCSETSLSLWRRNPIPNMAGVDRRAGGAKIKREGCSKAALLHYVHQVDAKGMLENFDKKECSQED